MDRVIRDDRSSGDPMDNKDTVILRELAKQYLEVCADPVQEERRALWRRHNSLKKTRPLIYVRALAWREMPQSRCLCQDPFYREYEDTLRYKLFCGRRFRLRTLDHGKRGQAMRRLGREKRALSAGRSARRVQV